jgi:hypothetical protein
MSGLRDYTYRRVALLDDDKQGVGEVAWPAFIIVLAVAVITAVAAAITAAVKGGGKFGNYNSYANADSPGNDYRNVPINSNMYDLCDKDSNCVGFTSDGRLKNKILEKSKWVSLSNNATLYVKENADKLLQKHFSRTGIAVNEMPPYNSIPLDRSRWGLTYRLAGREIIRKIPIMNGELVQSGSNVYRIHLDGSVNPPVWVDIGEVINNSQTSLIFKLQQKGLHFRALAMNGKSYYVMPDEQNKVKNGGLVHLVNLNNEVFIPFNGAPTWNVVLNQAYNINNITTF